MKIYTGNYFTYDGHRGVQISATKPDFKKVCKTIPILIQLGILCVDGMMQRKLRDEIRSGLSLRKNIGRDLYRSAQIQ